MYYTPDKLLNRRNAKTIKGEKRRVITYILYLSSADRNDHHVNLCPFASPGCKTACLVFSGHARFSHVQSGRRNKTNYYLENRAGFLAQLVSEIAAKVRNLPKGYQLAIRLNGTSDIAWEKQSVEFEGKTYRNIMLAFPGIMFYDYTKNPYRFDKPLPKNYYLVFSRSETNDTDAQRLLKRGVNISVVFEERPKKFWGRPVIDGDIDDLRFRDRKGIIIGLSYKPATVKSGPKLNKQARTTGFVIPVDKIQVR